MAQYSLTSQDSGLKLHLSLQVMDSHIKVIKSNTYAILGLLPICYSVRNLLNLCGYNLITYLSTIWMRKGVAGEQLAIEMSIVGNHVSAPVLFRHNDKRYCILKRI